MARRPTTQWTTDHSNLQAGKRLLENKAGGADVVGAAMSESDTTPPGVSAGGTGQDSLGFPQLDMSSVLKQLASMGGGGGGYAPAAGGGGGGSWAGGPTRSGAGGAGWQGLQEGQRVWTERLLGAFPQLRFSSGYRSPARNAAVGGVPNSRHMSGWASDISGSSAMLHQAAAWGKKYGAKTLLHDAGSGFHLHISWRGVPF